MERKDQLVRLLAVFQSLPVDHGLRAEGVAWCKSGLRAAQRGVSENGLRKFAAKAANVYRQVSL